MNVKFSFIADAEGFNTLTAKAANAQVVPGKRPLIVLNKIIESKEIYNLA